MARQNYLIIITYKVIWRQNSSKNLEKLSRFLFEFWHQLKEICIILIKQNSSKNLDNLSRFLIEFWSHITLHVIL